MVEQYSSLYGVGQCRSCGLVVRFFLWEHTFVHNVEEVPGSKM